MVATGPFDTAPFPTAFPVLVAITDLLDRIPFSPRADAGGDSGPADRPFSVEVPEVERAGIDLPESAALPEAPPPGLDGPPVGTPRPAPAPLPSYAIVVIGGLALLCVALSAALAVTVAEAGPPAETAADATAETPPAGATAEASTAAATADAPSAAYTADPAPIPVDLITRLEEASEEPLDVELSRLLDAIQHGFDRRSVALEPTLRSYVYRMSSRFEWNPDTFRVAVTAPDAALAQARTATLTHLFEDAAASGRLQVRPGVGPHALSLVTE